MTRSVLVAVPSSDASADAWNALSGLVMETMLFHRAWARRQGLTPFQFMVIKSLHEFGPLQPSRLAEQFGISRSAVTSATNALESQGWIQRAHPADDRRTLLASVTPKAIRVLQAAQSEYRTRLSRALSRVPAEERAQLTRTMATILAELRDGRDRDGSARAVGR